MSARLEDVASSAGVPSSWRPSAATLLVVALLSFRFSGVVEGFFRPSALDLSAIRAGHALERVVGGEDLVVTVEYERFGNNLFFYWLRFFFPLLFQAGNELIPCLTVSKISEDNRSFIQTHPYFI